MGHALPCLAQVAARLNLPGGAGEPGLAEDVYGPLSGQVTSAVRQGLRRAVAEAHPRLVEAMLLCEVASAAEALSGECRGWTRRQIRKRRAHGSPVAWRGVPATAAVHVAVAVARQ